MGARAGEESYLRAAPSTHPRSTSSSSDLPQSFQRIIPVSFSPTRQ